MPRPRLSPDQVDFIMKMKAVEYSNSEIARRLGVTEGAIRYRVKRAVLGKQDGRRLKPSSLESYRAVIEQWGKDYEEDRRRPTLKTLFEWLRTDQGYRGSYDAFRRYIRKACPQFHKKGAWVRVETPAGALSFADWKEDLLVQMGRAGRWLCGSAPGRIWRVLSTAIRKRSGCLAGCRGWCGPIV